MRFSCALVGVLTLLGACTLIDPLDDITGGRPPNKSDGGGTSTDDSGGIEPSDAGATDTKAPTGTCGDGGITEIEPNDAVAQNIGNANGQQTVCGSLSQNDIDMFTFTADVGGWTVNFLQLDKSGLHVSISAPGQNIDSDGAQTTYVGSGAGTVHVTLSRSNAAVGTVTYEMLATF